MSNTPAPNNPPAGPTALMDMTSGATYLGFGGGLYENFSDAVPSDHDLAGKQMLAQVQTLDGNGNPSPSGKVVFLGMGMSHVYYEFGDFVSKIQNDSRVNHTTMVAINGGQLGKTACFWTVTTGVPSCDPPDPEPPCTVSSRNAYDIVRDCYLTPAGLTEKQVQVAWLKQADKEPAVNGLLPLCNSTDPNCADDDTTDAIHYERLLGDILRAAKIRYPNLKQVFISSRSYGGYATIPLNPEPFAYENGFAVKWLVQAQINQARGMGVDSVAGDLDYASGKVPWVAWGPYLWADGPHPRSDGLVWCNGQPDPPCNGEEDFRADDHTHPSPEGEAKVTKLLLDYFLNSPYSTWFRP
ncbi:MAG TPA: hypothetical protein VH437_17310 [Terriglobales bacterium]